MNNVLRGALAAAAGVAAAGALAFPASAATVRHHPSPSASVTTTPPVAVKPRPGTSALTIVLVRPDSGGNGNWAYDTFLRYATVGTQVPADSSHCGEATGACWLVSGATLTDTDGTFQAVRGAFTPNQGAPFTGRRIRHAVRGQMGGAGSFGPFYATALPTLRPVFVSYGSANPSSTWPEMFFAPGTAFTGLAEGTFAYRYSAGGQRWADTSADGDGQLRADGNITG